MFRQAELERAMYTSSATFYTCHSAHPAPSEADTEPSVESFDSSHSLNTASKLHFPPDSPAQTAAELEAAMASPLLSLSQSSFDHGSQESLSPCDSPTSMKHTRSLTELDVLASSMVLSKFDCGMDFESNDGHQECDVADNQAVSDTLSCGAKRPFTRRGAEEDKRRRVDEAMVVEEAVDTGVIVPNNTQCLPSSFPGSASNLSQGQLGSPAVFGHVVKTSDTHPIIISPFFPAELLPVLSAHLVPPQCSGAFSTQSPMTSAIDVPSLLLSFIPPAPNPELAPSSMQSVFRQQQIAQQSSHVQNLGNLLLSSCPGKRLRMGGPVKGRGPVCRDLCTDLRRIKSEGVGCLIW